MHTWTSCLQCVWVVDLFLLSSEIKSLGIISKYSGPILQSLSCFNLRKPWGARLPAYLPCRVWEHMRRWLSDGWFLKCSQRGLLSAWACVQRRVCMCSLLAFPRCRKASCLFALGYLFVLVYAACLNWKTLLCKGWRKKYVVGVETLPFSAFGWPPLHVCHMQFISERNMCHCWCDVPCHKSFGDIFWPLKILTKEVCNL